MTMSLCDNKFPLTVVFEVTFILAEICADLQYRLLFNLVLLYPPSVYSRVYLLVLRSDRIIPKAPP
jgi:hypothetical protein